jgi:hypothetical protein
MRTRGRQPTVRRVLVQHKRVSCLDLSLEDSVPKLLSRHGLLRPALLLVLVEQRAELVAIDLVESRRLGGTEKRPVAGLLDPLHEEIWNPEGKEEVPRANLLLPVVLAEIEELEDVRVPWLEVDGERSRTLVASLVDIACRVVVDTEHRDNAVRVPVCSRDVRSRRADVVNAESNPTGRLGDESARLEGVVDPLDRVVLHRDEEARGELRVGSSGVKESGGGVGEVALRHEVVGLENSVDVFAVYSDGDAHEHVLRTLSNFAVDAKEVRAFQRFEAEVVLWARRDVHQQSSEDDYEQQDEELT